MKLILSVSVLFFSITVLANSDGMNCVGTGMDGSEIIFDTRTFSLNSKSNLNPSDEALNLRTLEANYPMVGEIYTFGASINGQVVATLTLDKLLREFDIWEEGGEPCDGGLGLGFGAGSYGSTMVYQAIFRKQNFSPVQFELVCKAAANYSADCRFDEWMYESF